METPRVSPEEMERKHVVRYRDCKGSDLAYLDQRMPEHAREIVNVIGMNVTENTDDPLLRPKLGNAYGFSLVYNKAFAGSGSGPAFHSHQTEEVFIPMKGTWEVVWLEGETERAVRLEPLDVCSVPVGIYRGFRLVSGEADAMMLAIVGGPEAGHVAWHPSVIEKARATGLEVDDQGNLRKIAAE
ncbi:MAG: cupin domain-containing protein [Alphaproteobacteria bacterium]